MWCWQIWWSFGAWRVTRLLCKVISLKWILPFSALLTRRKVVWNRRLGTTYRSHLQRWTTDVSGLPIGCIFKGQALQENSWPLNTGPTSRPETSVSNYLTLRNNGIIHFKRGGSLRSRVIKLKQVLIRATSDRRRKSIRLWKYKHTILKKQLLLPMILHVIFRNP